MTLLRADIPPTVAVLVSIGLGLSYAAMGLGARLAKGYVDGGVLRPGALRRLAEAGALGVRVTQGVMYTVHAAGLGAAMALLVKYLVDGPGLPG